MKAIGQYECVVSPYWPHTLLGAVLDIMPESIVASIITSMHMATRKRGMKKDSAKKTE